MRLFQREVSIVAAVLLLAGASAWAQALRAVASNWRISGILNARSGSWLTVTSGRDNVFNGMANQRVDQVSDDVYGPKTLTNYLNPAAFAQPAAGTFGTHQRNSNRGSTRWIWRCRVSYS